MAYHCSKMQRELGDDLCGSFEAMTVIVYHFLVDGPSAAEAKLMQVSRFTQLIPVLSECHVPPPRRSGHCALRSKEYGTLTTTKHT